MKFRKPVVIEGVKADEPSVPLIAQKDAFWFEGVPHPTFEAAKAAEWRKKVEAAFPEKSFVGFPPPGWRTTESEIRDVLLDDVTRGRVVKFLLENLA